VPGFERTIHSAPPLDLSGGRGRGGGGARRGTGGRAPRGEGRSSASSRPRQR